MIRLDHVHRVFEVGDQEVHALKDVTLEIAEREYLSIMGPSGSGKSTLLHIVGLLDTPTEGACVLFDQEVAELSEADQARTRLEKIGFVFQFFHLVPRMTAAQNVELPLMLAGVPASQRQERVAAALDAFGISDRGDHRPDQLSGGQRQRVAIARAIILEPLAILADEPTGNLDQTSGNEVVRILEELNEKGMAVIVVTHDPEIGGRAARRIRLVDGEVVEDSER